MKKRVLFVCLGNICRSPTAEGVFRHVVEKAGLTEFYEIDSAGTNGYHDGELPDPRMRRHGALRGYDFKSISRQVPPGDFKRFDHIVAMDESNITNLRSFCPSEDLFAKVSKMTDYNTELQHPEVPDPYYGGANGFELVLDIVEDACQGLLNQLERERRS